MDLHGRKTVPRQLPDEIAVASQRLPPSSDETAMRKTVTRQWFRSSERGGHRPVIRRNVGRLSEESEHFGPAGQDAAPAGPAPGLGGPAPAGRDRRAAVL